MTQRYRQQIRKIREFSLRLTLPMSKPYMLIDLCNWILWLEYIVKKINLHLKSNVIIPDNLREIVMFEESEALPKNTDLTINIQTKECGEMKAHTVRHRGQKYDLQIYLPVFVGNNSKENILSSEILHKYQLLIRELLMCKFVCINPAIPMSLLVAYLILSSITINDAEGKKLMKFWNLKYSYNNAADRLFMDFT
ncbi:unnamed protein product [Mytilus edulis]|uniref:Uncharacterized protein n=1 Tax=Mytilus edulis TaxID=6550 RepID=A0A8S3TGD9_MYTED|nr:unnamed protein product [Mytilus edulis]